MGYSLSWAALKGGDVESVCAALDLRPTGNREEVAEAKIDGVRLPTGWYAVLFDHHEVKDSTLEKLSRIGEVVSCFVEDHVMFSSASRWVGGKEIWKVWHDGGEKGVFHLETAGNLPADFESIRQELFAQQDQEQQERVDGTMGTDYVYDLPAELAKKLVGFRMMRASRDCPAKYTKFSSRRSHWAASWVVSLAGRRTNDDANAETSRGRKVGPQSGTSVTKPLTGLHFVQLAFTPQLPRTVESSDPE